MNAAPMVDSPRPRRGHSGPPIRGALAQPGAEQTYQRIDGIVAVVGDEIVLMSDILDRVSQARLEGRDVSQDNQCGLLESMLL